MEEADRKEVYQAMKELGYPEALLDLNMANVMRRERDRDFADVACGCCGRRLGIYDFKKRVFTIG